MLGVDESSFWVKLAYFDERAISFREGQTFLEIFGDLEAERSEDVLACLHLSKFFHLICQTVFWENTTLYVYISSNF